MKMLEYKLHAPANGVGMSIPPWVHNGGHWYKGDDHTMIGFSPDTTEYYVPDSVDFKTLADLKARQVAVHAKYPYKVMDSNGQPTADDMTNAQVETWVEEWHTATNV